MSPVATWLASAVVLAALYWPLEWAWPARVGQPRLRPRLATDFLFFTGQYLAWNALAVGLLVLLRARVDTAGLFDGIRGVVARQPFVFQALEALLLGDLSVYWFHRASHRFEFLWRFHAVHHTAGTLDWVAAHREHPVDGLLTQLALNLPGLLMGFDFATLSSFSMLRGLWAIFIHSNVRLALGPLAWLLGSPQWHRWHHAKHPGAVANFANLAPWCDVLFGTHHPGVQGDETFELGVPEVWPSSYPAQLLAPLIPRAWWPRIFGLPPAVASRDSIAVACSTPASTPPR